MYELYKKKIINLTQEQFLITQKSGTEKAFENKYWDQKSEGIYIDVISGEPLFSSVDKYNSGSGWPSFTKTLPYAEILEIADISYGIRRTELRSNTSHLGHIFDDGPEKRGGKRYCVNSGALKFICKEDLLKTGYGDFVRLFTKEKQKREERAYIAGGCFWGIEHLVRKQRGILATKVGYGGGQKLNPTYVDVCKGDTGHAETVEIIFDPKETNYRKILKLFFKMHDASTLNEQGNDKGTQYRSAILYVDEVQKHTALQIKQRINNSGIHDIAVTTEVTKLRQFYMAEEFHQKYLEKKPWGYNCHILRSELKI